MCTGQWRFGRFSVFICVVMKYVGFQFLLSAVTFWTMTALELFLTMDRQMSWEIILSREWFFTYLTNVHPCCRRPLCSSFHGGMRSPFLSTQYVDKDESISCKGRQVGRRVHYKLAVGRGSVQRPQQNVYVDNNFNIPHHTVHYQQKGDINARSILYKLKLYFHWNSASLYPEQNVYMYAYIIKVYFHWNSASLYPEQNVYMCAYNFETFHKNIIVSLENFHMLLAIPAFRKFEMFIKW